MLLEQVLDAAPDADDERRSNWENNLTVIYFHLHQVASKTGDIEAARAWAEKSLDRSQQLSARRPEVPEFGRSLALAYAALGDVAEAEGDTQRARELYEQALATSRSLAESVGATPASPDEPMYQHDVAVSFSKLGELAAFAGAFEEAGQWWEKQLEITRRLVEAEPENAVWRSDLADVHERLARVANSLGDRGRLTGSSPAESRHPRGPGAGRAGEYQLAAAPGRLLPVSRRSRGRRRPGRGRRVYDKALRITQAVVEKEPANLESLRTLALCHLSLGEMARRPATLAGRASGTRSTWPSPSGWWRPKRGARRRGSFSPAPTTGSGAWPSRWETRTGAATTSKQALEIFRQLAAAQPDNESFPYQMLSIYWGLGELAADGEIRQRRAGSTSNRLHSLSASPKKGPGDRGRYALNLLACYEILSTLLAESEPDQARRYLELYREVRNRFQDLEFIKDMPQL